MKKKTIKPATVLILRLCNADMTSYQTDRLIAKLRARVEAAERRADEMEGKAGEWIAADIHRERVKSAVDEARQRWRSCGGIVAQESAEQIAALKHEVSGRLSEIAELNAEVASLKARLSRAME